jgi:hypothetical protein
MKPEFTLLDDEVENPEAPVTLSQLLAQQQQSFSQMGREVLAEDMPPSLLKQGINTGLDIALGRQPSDTDYFDFGKGLLKQGVRSAVALPGDAIDAGVWLGNRVGDYINPESPEVSLGAGDRIRSAFDSFYDPPASKEEELGGKFGKWGAPAGMLGGAKALGAAGVGALAEIFGTEALGLSDEEAESLGVVTTLASPTVRGVGKAVGWATKNIPEGLRNAAMQAKQSSGRVVETVDGFMTTTQEALRRIREVAPEWKRYVAEGPSGLAKFAETKLRQLNSAQEGILKKIDQLDDLPDIKFTKTLEKINSTLSGDRDLGLKELAAIKAKLQSSLKSASSEEVAQRAGAASRRGDKLGARLAKIEADIQVKELGLARLLGAKGKDFKESQRYARIEQLQADINKLKTTISVDSASEAARVVKPGKATKGLEAMEPFTPEALGSKKGHVLNRTISDISDDLGEGLRGFPQIQMALKQDLADYLYELADRATPGGRKLLTNIRERLSDFRYMKDGLEETMRAQANRTIQAAPVASVLAQHAAPAFDVIKGTAGLASMAPGAKAVASALPGVVGDMNYTPVEEGPPPAFALQPENELAPQEAAFELLPDDLATPVEQMPVNGAMAPSGGAFQGVAYNPEIPPQSLPRSSDDFFSIAEEALGPLLEDPEIADLMQQAKSGPPVIKRTALAGIIEKRPELFPPVDHPYLSGYTIVDRHIVSADKAIQYGQREMYADDLKRRVDAGLVSRSTYAKALSSLNTDGYVMELDMPIDKVSQYDDLIEDAAKEFNLPPNLIRAVIRQESSGDANATGPQTKYGVARGLMQIMQSATDEVAKMGIKVTDPYDPKQNIRAGAAYLAKNIERVKKTWNGEDTSDLYSKALGAYHSGIGNLTKVGYDVSKLGPQGRAYVKKVMKNFSAYSELLDDNYPIEDRANAIDALASQKKPSTSA